MKIGMAVELAMVLAAFGLGGIAIWRARRAKQSVIDLLGLRWNRMALPDFAAGVLIAGAAMVAIFSTEQALGGIAVDASRDATAAHLAGEAFVKLLIIFKEEFVMRSLLLTGLLMLMRGRQWQAIAISAIAFGLTHISNPGSTPISILGNAAGGVIYGLAFVKAGNLWMPMGLHFAWNFVQGPLLGFPVSGMDAGGLWTLTDAGPEWLTGGAYGPEAGVVGIAYRFLILALVISWLAWKPRPTNSIAKDQLQAK